MIENLFGVFKSFIRSKLEYGMAILNYSMKEIDQIDKVQREALCDMFSFPRNSSANTLRIVSGIVKMERRQNLLRANFIARQLETENNPSTLLPRVNRWVKSTGLVSHLDKMKKKSNFELTPYHEANELIIKDLHHRHMKSEMKIFQSELFASIQWKIGRLTKARLESLFDYSPHKILGKLKACCKCGSPNSQNHLIR